MLIKTARFFSFLFVIALLFTSNLLLLLDSFGFFNLVLARLGVDPLIFFIISWAAILLLRVTFGIRVTGALFYFFLYIVVPISTVVAFVLTFVELSHFYNYVYSNWFIHFDRVVLWCFSTWLFSLVLVPQKVFVSSWKKIVFIAPVLLLVGLGLVWTWPQDVFLELVKEDNLIENLQVFILFVGSVAAIQLVKLRVYNNILIAGTFLLVSLGLFFIAGDEISWGQRILGFTTPEQIVQDNVQDETTLHNIDGIHQLIGYGYILIALYGSFAWIFAEVFLDRRKNLTKYFVPKSYFFFYFYLSLVYNSYSLNGPHQYGEWSEVAELLLYSGISLFLVTRLLEAKKSN